MTETHEWIRTVIGGAGVAVAFFQLRRLNKSLKLNGVLGIVQLEIEINNRRTQLANVSHEISLEGNKTKSAARDKRLVTLDKRLEVDTEAYLNAVDRLAYCILKNYFPNREWKIEYRDFIATEISDHSEFFGPDTRYDNILKLHNKWKES